MSQSYSCMNVESMSELAGVYVKKINREKKETIIMGDLNCNYLNDNDHKEIKDIFTTNGFTQLLKTPTRVTATTSTLIDIIITSNPLNISGTSNICAGLSDHNLTACTRKINSVKYQPETIICRNFSNYRVDSINRELLNADWNELYTGVAARVFEWGGQKFDKILNLPHYAWMTDKIVRPKELLIPPKISPLYLNL